jgi:hypothetical protein
MRATSQEPALRDRLAALGLEDAQLELAGDAVILRFPSEKDGERLLSDSTLRQALVASVQACGFSRVSLELSGEG